MRSRSLAGHAGLAAAAIGAVALAGCSEPSFAEDAEDYLNEAEGPNGEDYSDASCEEPESTEVGATFACTTLDANGATISWVGEITPETSGQDYVLREAGSEDAPADATSTTTGTSATPAPAAATTTTAAATTTAP